MGNVRALLRVEGWSDHVDEGAGQGLRTRDHGDLRSAGRDFIVRPGTWNRRDDRGDAGAAIGNGRGGSGCGAVFPERDQLRHRSGAGRGWRLEPAVNRRSETCATTLW